MFLVGADQFAAFLSWKEPERVLALARLGVATRPGYRARAARLAAASECALRARARRLSSTEIRDALARGESLDGLVPPAVAA